MQGYFESTVANAQGNAFVTSSELFGACRAHGRGDWLCCLRANKLAVQRQRSRDGKGPDISSIEIRAP